MRHFAVFVFILLYSATGSTQGFPLGDQFQVNTYTTGVQEYPAVACDAQGNFVIVWLNPYGSPPFILGQRYLADGAPVGSEFQVNTLAGDELDDLEIAMADDGRFVVVWTSNGDLDGSADSVRGQRFFADATPNGTEMQLNNTTYANQSDPSVAMRNDGSFVVVWMGYGVHDESGIHGQAFTWNGITVAGEFGVNNIIGVAGSSQPDVAVDSIGDFIASWQTYDSIGVDQPDENIKARCFGWGGLPYGPQFQVNSDSTGWQLRTAVGAAPDGSALVLFQDDALGIRGQHYSANCTPVGDNFEVNSPFGLAGFPDVTADDLGRFVVSYEASELYGRLIPDPAPPTSEPFPIPSQVFTPQHLKISAVPDGRFIATWRSWGSNGNDPDYSIQARLFAGFTGLFFDDFETGDTSEWDETSP